MASLSVSVRELVINSVKAIKGTQIAAAKLVTSKKGNDLRVVSEVGGWAPEIIGSITVDGKTYNVGLKFSVTLTEATGAKAKTSDVI